jgi:phosphoheptose isomerase
MATMPQASLALGTKNSFMSAICNHYGYEQTFPRALICILLNNSAFIQECHITTRYILSEFVEVQYFKR